MNKIKRSSAGFVLGLGLVIFTAAAEPSARTLYVSKLGDNSDGSSWARAYTTVQAALSAVPDDRGGHRIIIRPDTYFEAMLFPAQKGAASRYNQLVGDVDGRFGSGATGSVVIDSGDPGQKGFKSYDWWGPFRSYAKGWSPEHKEATFSAIGWDRWRLANLYVTGGDGGIFFDLTDRVKPFSVLVEDCVGLGRAFGGGVASCLSRPDEPITFRRCHLWALDFWGDTSGAYCRVENAAMPSRPDVVFEDCVMVGPQCSLKGSNFGFHTFTRVKVLRCRLVTLNFSQPPGTPTDGIIQSVQEGKLLHVDLEDTTLMGYKVFGVIVKKDTAGEIGYTVKGDVKAYVQFQQAVPKGIYRLAGWPVDVFQSITPPLPRRRSPYISREIVKADLCELAPFTWKGRPAWLECVRPSSGGMAKDHHLLIRDVQTSRGLAKFAEGFGLGSILVHEGAAYVFASRWEAGGWRDVTMFRSRDLRTWESRRVIQGENEGLFNTSVCRGPDGFVMAYESDEAAYPAFTIKFARSKDLLTWTKMPEATFGTNRYTACPCVRYENGYYYVLYLERRTPRWFFETYISRSKDLVHWELSSANPVLTPEGLDEGINASDPELAEEDGRTSIYFAVGDQLSWMNLKRAVYPGRLREFLESWFKTPGIPDWGSAGAVGHAKAEALSCLDSPAPGGLVWPQLNAGRAMTNRFLLLAAIAPLFVNLASSRAPVRASVPAKSKMLLVINFDVEDYTTPASEGIDDIPKWLAEIMSEEGVTGTFYVIGEKARSLEQRGRRDVIAAMARHDIGSHTNFGSIHPTVTEVLEKADWAGGMQSMLERESAGFGELERIFGVPIVTMGRHGGSYGPQLVAALAKLRKGFSGSPVGLPGRTAAWFCNALNFSFQYGGYDDVFYRDDLFEPAFEKLKAELPELAKTHEAVSFFCGHPTKIRSEQFWDFNYYAGKNPPPAEWKTPPLRPLESMTTAQKNFRRLVRWLKSRDDIEITTFRSLMDRFKGQKEVLTSAELTAIAAEALRTKTLSPSADFSPAETFAGLAESIAVFHERGALPGELKAVRPFGPPELPEAGTPQIRLGLNEIFGLAEKAIGDIRRTGALPSTLAAGSSRLGPGSLFALFSAVYLDLAAGRPQAAYGVAPFEPYPRTNETRCLELIQGYKSWPVHRPNLDMARILEYTKLQLWTLKPARRG